VKSDVGPEDGKLGQKWRRTLLKQLLTKKKNFVERMLFTEIY